MSQKFKNKYRSETTRLKKWDYGWNASYFVTICTKDRKHYFGKISDSQLIPSPIGEIAEREWLKSFEIRPDMNLTMGEYVVMPNHFHAIIGIGENEYNTMDRCAMHCASTLHCASTPPIMHCASTLHCASTPPIMHCASTMNGSPTTNPPKNKFGPQSKNLASIIRGFKIGVTKNARIINPDFAWQSRFHDHIIRNEAAFQRISKYIIHNPSNWNGDTFS